MGNREFRSFARMARPIITRRDYYTVRKLVSQRARAFFFVEAERLEALIRELTDYEGRRVETEASMGWSRLALGPGASREGRPRRRWSDAAH